MCSVSEIKVSLNGFVIEFFIFDDRVHFVVVDNTKVSIKMTLSLAKFVKSRSSSACVFNAKRFL